MTVKKPISDKMAAKEIATSEKLALEGEQMMRALGDSRTNMTVLPKAIESLSGRFETRLAPHLLQQVYSLDYDPASQSPHHGMALYERLKGLAAQLANANDLVSAVHNPSATADEILAAVDKIEFDKNLKVTAPSNLFELALKRECEHTAAHRNWPQLMAALG